MWNDQNLNISWGIKTQLFQQKIKKIINLKIKFNEKFKHVLYVNTS